MRRREPEINIVADPASPESAPLRWPLAPDNVVRSDGVERRANSRALTYWKQIAAPRRFPSASQVTKEGAADLWEYLFIVEIAPKPDQYRYVLAGGVLREALGRDPTGETVTTALPGGMGTRTVFLQQAAVGLKGPVDDAGMWVRNDGAQILYRAMLLPLSDDQQTVSHLLGAFSFKLAAPV
jgi:hypothetical protein